jgi:signal transduction histidine kinase
VEDILDVARQRLEGGLPVDRRPIDVASLCKRVIDESEAFHPAHVIRWDATGDLWANLDEERVAQLLSNLVENAVRYSASATTVTVSAVGSADAITLAVHNIGPVIPNSLFHVLFDPLVRGMSDGESRTRPANLGLGLFIVRAIAQAHGGSVAVSSTEDAGTTFTVTLPREVQRDSGEPEE